MTKNARKRALRKRARGVQHNTPLVRDSVSAAYRRQEVRGSALWRPATARVKQGPRKASMTLDELLDLTYRYRKGWSV